MAQASPEEETVLDGTLHHSEEDSGSELDWGNDSICARFCAAWNEQIGKRGNPRGTRIRTNFPVDLR
jgi:hypothetical protein